MNVFFRSLKNSNRIIAGIIISSLLFLSACVKTNDNSNNIPTAGLMAFNLVPDQSSAGILLSGNLLPGSPMEYTNYTGGYLSIFTGERSITSFDFFSNNTLARSTSVFTQGKYYSLFVIGANKKYTNLVVNDNLDSLNATKGQAYVRYINAIADSSKPLVTLKEEKGTISENAAFSRVSDFVPFTAGELTVSVNNDSTIKANRTIQLQESKAYTILLIGQPGATDAAKKVQIRFIENGTLTSDIDQKTSGSANSRKSN